MTTEAQRKAQKKYAESEKGQLAIKRATERYEAENAEQRREYKRQKAQEYRLREKSSLIKEPQSATAGSLESDRATQTLILAFTLLNEFSSIAQPMDFAE